MKSTLKSSSQKIKAAILLICLLAVFSNKTQAQTTLYAGDVAFIASQMNNNTGDTFAIVLLKDIVSGTQIGFTDGCYKDANGYNILTSNKNEWYFIWEAGSLLRKGTIIKFWNSDNTQLNAGGTTNASTGSIVKGDALSLNHNGGTDQIFAFQDTVSVDLTNYRLTVGRYLAGIHHNFINGTTSDANWDGVASAPGLFQSELPDSLVNGTHAIRLDSSSIKRENAVFTSNILSLDKTVINNVANWTFSNTPVTATIPVRAVWTGSWNGTTSSTVDAVIQSNTAPGTFTCKSLRVDTGYNLTVTSGQTTNIYGDFYNYGNGVGSSNGNITFYKTGTANLYGSSAISFIGIIRARTGTTLQTNSLLTLNATGASTYGQIGAGGSDNGTISGNITASYYIGGSTEGWRSICSPLDGATLAQVNDDIPLNFGTPNSNWININRFDESGSSPHWTAPSSLTQSMDAGGFAVYIRSAILPLTLDITGTYNGTSNYVLSGLTRTGSTTDTSGWHIIRNPWPTGFYWDGSIANVQGTSCYIYDRTSGTYTVFDNINDGIIPPFTAFTLRVTSNNVSVTLPNSSRNVALATNYMDKSFSVDNYIGLTVKNLKTGVSDKANFYIDANANNGIDNFDGIKKMNDAVAPNLYFTSTGSNLYKEVWQSIPTNGIDLPLNFSTQSADEHQITADLQNIELGTEVYIEDLQNQKLYDVTKGAINFNVNPNDVAERFVLHIRKNGTATSIKDVVAANYFIGSNNTNISIASTKNETINVEVADLMGRTIYTSTLQSSVGTTNMLPTLNTQTGYYIVRVTGDSGMQVAKVFLK
jgi:hypothetical protein